MPPDLPARRTNRAITVIGLVLALAMGALEATVVSTAMPSVIGDLGGIELYAWVTTAYLLTSSITVPIYGKLADIYGRKPVLLFGIAVFLFGSAASGAASTMTQLIVFRALQGVGAGSMQPVAMTVVGDIFDVSERARIQGVFGAFWGLFGMIGPAIGGFCVEHLSWRWVFYLNLPFGVAAAAIIIFALHERIERRPHVLDVSGALLLTSGLTLLLLATSGAVPRLGAWPALAAAVLLAAFIAVERRAAEPVLPLPLFTRPIMLTASISGAIVGGAMLAVTTFIPLFVQGVLRRDPTAAGTAFTPMLVGWPIASTLAGRYIPKVGFRPLIRGGLAITAVAGVALALFGERHGLAGLRVITGIFGVGMGMSSTALVIAVQTSVGWDQRGIATASTMFFRTIGGALAVSGMGGVLNAVLARDPAISHDIASRVLSPTGVRDLDPSLLERVGRALEHGIGWIFWLTAASTIAAFIVSLWFPHVPTPAQRSSGATSAH
ncbi:drug resistance transporter, EmrB/QacA family protein [Minicystis rosea]|nr:drug resistance transporter, EmrB/QacA family protein [Minicystis rosea]